MGKRIQYTLKLNPSTIISTALLLLVLLGIGGAIMYYIALIVIVYVSVTNTIDFIWLMMLNQLAIYELGNPYTVVLGVSFYHTDIFLVACAVYILRQALSSSRAHFSKQVRNTVIVASTVVFFGVYNGVINGALFKNVMREINYMGPYMLVAVTTNAVKTKEQILRFTSKIVHLGVALSILGIAMRIVGVENLSGFPGSESVGTTGGVVSRAYGLSGATSFMIATLFILLATIKTESRKRLINVTDNVRITSIVLALIQLLLLFARSLFLGVAAGLVALIPVSGSKRMLKILLALLAAVSALYLFSAITRSRITDSIADRYLSVVSTKYGGESAQANIDYRTDEMAEVWESLSWGERIFGMGLGTRLSIEVLARIDVISYHNAYAQAIQKIGIVGLMVYISFILVTYNELLAMKKYIVYSSDLYPIACGFYVTFIALAIWGSGTMGMPLRANVVACVSLGVFFRIGIQARRLKQTR